MGRRRGRRGSGKTHGFRGQDLYGGGSCGQGAREDEESSATEDLRRVRREARELMRRNPGDRKSMERAAQLLVKAARAERYLTGGRKEPDMKQLGAVMEGLWEQLGPSKVEGS